MGCKCVHRHENSPLLLSQISIILTQHKFLPFQINSLPCFPRVCTCRDTGMWASFTSVSSYLRGWGRHFHNTDQSRWHMVGTDHLVNERTSGRMRISQGHWPGTEGPGGILRHLSLANVNCFLK